MHSRFWPNLDPNFIAALGIRTKLRAMKKVALFLLLSVVTKAYTQVPKIAPQDLIQSGPMLGYSEMREVMLWVQTTESALVQIKYWVKDSNNPILETEVYQTQKSEGYTAHLIADEVRPGQQYEYVVYVNNEAAELEYETTFKSAADWSYKTDPPNFTVAIGSCTYINDEPFDRKGKPYGRDQSIFTSIHEKNPDLMIWLGDNTYYREADWGTKTGMIYRNTHTRSIRELQPLLANTHHYATWDDHDYGPNDHNRTFENKAMSLAVFQLFWGNLHYGFLDEKCAVSKWTWGDVDFYLLDDRWFRSANRLSAEEKVYFGKKQIDWLIENLKASRANYKIIGNGGQIINPAQVHENYANYAEERAYLLKRLEEENIWGVFFLSGDRHHTILSKMPRSNNYPLYDLTVSPLTSGSHTPEDEGNVYADEKTLVDEQNFAILDFNGEWGDRKMEITVYNEKGKKQWDKTLEVNELRPPWKK